MSKQSQEKKPENTAQWYARDAIVIKKKNISSATRALNVLPSTVIVAVSHFLIFIAFSLLFISFSLSLAFSLSLFLADFRAR